MTSGLFHLDPSRAPTWEPPEGCRPWRNSVLSLINKHINPIQRPRPYERKWVQSTIDCISNAHRKDGSEEAKASPNRRTNSVAPGGSSIPRDPLENTWKKAREETAAEFMALMVAVRLLCHGASAEECDAEIRACEHGIQLKSHLLF